MARGQADPVRRARRGPAQPELPLRTWGGKRAGAGRKRAARPGQPPRTWVRARPALSARTPVQVTVRVTPAVGRLRRRKAYQAVRRALLRVLVRGWMRVIHLSIQRTHVHLIIEAGDEALLARGMQGFEISAARQLNAAVGAGGRPRRGNVFVGRYHAVALTSPRLVRGALAYVLNNWRRHREDRGSHAARAAVDPYSSAVCFDGWREREIPFAWPRGYEPLPVAAASQWLLTVGWRRHGRIALGEVPGGARAGSSMAR